MRTTGRFLLLLLLGSVFTTFHVFAETAKEGVVTVAAPLQTEVFSTLEPRKTEARETNDKDFYEKANKTVEQKPLQEKIVNLLQEKLLPNLPGALLLFVFSAFFSSMNFFSEVSEQSRSAISVYKYLSVWILINYLFALIILFLILPETVGLKEVNKTLFLSCLLATAIPEISANLRLQLGKSNRALDLYKYKLKISGLISQKVTQANIERRSQQLISLALYYSNRMDQFRQKLQILMGQSDLTEEEKEGLKSLMEFVSGQSANMTIEQAVSTVLVRFQSVIPKLLDFFHVDVARFERSPVSLLMKGLQPLLTVDEARRLVEVGIVSPAKFSIRCATEAKRQDLAEKTGIDMRRITMLYFSSRHEYIHRRIRNISWVVVIVLILTVNIFLILNIYADRLGIKHWFPHQQTVVIGDLPPDMSAIKDKLDKSQVLGVKPLPESGVEGTPR